MKVDPVKNQLKKISRLCTFKKFVIRKRLLKPWKDIYREKDEWEDQGERPSIWSSSWRTALKILSIYKHSTSCLLIYLYLIWKRRSKNKYCAQSSFTNSGLLASKL